MADNLEALRELIDAPADAVRWACLLEAMSPKSGNVYPGKSFSDLSFLDFAAAAESLVEQLRDTAQPICLRMLRAVEASVVQTGTNVNLGIVLLLGPLVAADELMSSRNTMRTRQAWGEAVAEWLQNRDDADGQLVFQAIRSASAGALGSTDAMDVNATTGPVDLIEAMASAANRDRVARQYASGFSDLLDHVVPVVHDSITHCGDLLFGIRHAQLHLLRDQPDSLIARKNGEAVAADIQQQAQQLALDDPVAIARFDHSLRTSSNSLNPGTTADLIAAALYVLLRSPFYREPT